MNRYGEPDFKYIWAKIKQNGGGGEKGDKGDKGADGADGKSAYQYAVEMGYTGTESEFAQKLAQEIPDSTEDLINDSGYITQSEISAITGEEIVNICQ